MHEVQERLLNLAKSHDLSLLSYHHIARLLGVKHAQTIKYHLKQLEDKGLLTLAGGKIRVINRGVDPSTNLVSIPILGSANCGEAVRFADEKVEGYLRVSSALLTDKKDVFAVRAAGNSMNRSNIGGKSIEDGDFAIVSTRYPSPKTGDYVLSVIGGTANIKRFVDDRDNGQVVLLSESTESHPPIFIHPEDDYQVNGKVIQVIKQPKVSP